MTITNYFGPAFAVMDSSGQEVARFVENGNVLLMKPGADIHPSQQDLESIDPNAARFIVRKPLQSGGTQDVAVLTAAGHLYLTGTLTEDATGLTEPQNGQPAFVVKSKDGAVQCLIDDAGNLKVRGYLLVDGIQHRLLDHPDGTHYEVTDHYIPR